MGRFISLFHTLHEVFSHPGDPHRAMIQWVSFVAVVFVSFTAVRPASGAVGHSFTVDSPIRPELRGGAKQRSRRNDLEQHTSQDAVESILHHNASKDNDDLFALAFKVLA